MFYAYFVKGAGGGSGVVGIGGLVLLVGIGGDGGGRGGRLDAGRRAAAAEEADVAGADGRLEVGEQAVVVADLQRGAGLVDRAADLRQPEDLQEEVEVALMRPDLAEQAFEVGGLVDPLVEPD